jgi:hypothetical protein
MAAGAPSNAFGIDLNDINVHQLDPSNPHIITSQAMKEPEHAHNTEPSSEQSSPREDQSITMDPNDVQLKEKKKPYVNHERVKTGGAQRVRSFPIVLVRRLSIC